MVCVVVFCAVVCIVVVVVCPVGLRGVVMLVFVVWVLFCKGSLVVGEWGSGARV